MRLTSDCVTLAFLRLVFLLAEARLAATKSVSATHAALRARSASISHSSRSAEAEGGRGQKSGQIRRSNLPFQRLARVAWPHRPLLERVSRTHHVSEVGGKHARGDELQ